MTDDIRISLGICDHHKTKRLVRILGEPSFRCLIRLWCYVAAHRPKGILTGMDSMDIAVAADWGGSEVEFIAGMIDSGFISEDENGYFIHQWEKHNPWAFYSDERSDKAKRAAEARWNKRLGSADTDTAVLPDANGMLPAYTEHATSNAPSPNPLPSPSPTPSNSKTIELDYSSWPELPSEQVLKDWLAMRKRLKANVSQTVINRLSKELHKAGAAGHSVDDCLSECLVRNWKGFKLEWVDNPGGNNGINQQDTRGRAGRVADRLDDIARADIEKNGFTNTLDN